jgi:hypothetical protein
MVLPRLATCLADFDYRAIVGRVVEIIGNSIRT